MESTKFQHLTRRPQALEQAAPPEKGAIGIALLVWIFGGGLGLAILVFVLLKVF